MSSFESIKIGSDGGRPRGAWPSDRGEQLVAYGLSGLKTMEWKSTSDRISDDLRQMIIEGQLVPGEQLGEARIAELLGVSRAPVREALQQLVQEKLLVAARNKGVSVVSFTATDIWEIYDARYAIESHAAVRIIDGGPGMRARATDDLRAVLERLGTAAKRGNHREISATDLDFHMTLVASGATAAWSTRTPSCPRRPWRASTGWRLRSPRRAKRSSPTTRSSSTPSPPAIKTNCSRPSATT